MSKHLLSTSPNGRFTAFYMSDAENVTIYDATAKMWKYVLDETGTLDQLQEIVEGPTTPNVDEFLWLINTLQSVDTWLETCPHDLHRFGEVGVSF